MELKKVDPVKVEKNISVNNLVLQMENAGVMGGGKIGKAADIFTRMIQDEECRVFLGAAGALVPGGQRELLIYMLENHWIDVFVCTGAMLTHDLIEGLGMHHYKGNHMVNDKELNEKGIDRIYDSFMKNDVYITLEDFFNSHNFEGEYNIKEFMWKIGENIKDKSILKICYEKKIPIFCPGISDSGIGLMIWGLLNKNKRIKVDVFNDLKDIMEIVWTAKKTGVIYLGGGSPKNFIQQAMQFNPLEGASYGIQITMDRPEPGGSSGAELREGISWGKLNEKAKFVDVICDVTIALPLIVNAVVCRV
ncbi:MAG TPA: deoxyhypusine synthase [Candidatus Nanoarchaeia archaeon]|nr:deoxyhypusine synthase [Candidatus Nanoarchaeia archaeon]